jgi:ribosomal protein S18 acetylase RimI-like enzyme
LGAKIFNLCYINRIMNRDIIIKLAAVEDAAEILALQKLAYLSEAAIYNDYTIQPLKQTLEEIREDFKQYIFLKAVQNGVIIGSVKGQLEQQSCYIGRLMVHPDFQNRGIGTRLMQAIEAQFPQVKEYTLGTGHRSERNIRLYQKLGYKICSSEPVSDILTIVHLEKPHKI